ncbi:hypothetical protein ACFQX9_30010 [Bradyrhizobium sp. GCM10028915]|uniref:hypothetical protein n=1 Tax=Bradyrhizobium sp. GCM10028915 TaxID=3273385 RepID=UPI0036125420
MELVVLIFVKPQLLRGDPSGDHIAHASGLHHGRMALKIRGRALQFCRSTLKAHDTDANLF